MLEEDGPALQVARGRIATVRDPVDAQDVAVVRRYEMILHRITAIHDDLRLFNNNNFISN